MQVTASIIVTVLAFSFILGLTYEIVLPIYGIDIFIYIITGPAVLMAMVIFLISHSLMEILVKDHKEILLDLSLEDEYHLV